MHNSAITNNSRVPQLSTPLEDLKTIFQSKFTSKYVLSMALYWHVSLFFLAMTTISKMVSSVWTELKLLSCTAIHTIVPPLIFHSESAKLWSFYMFPNYNCVDQNEWSWNLIKKSISICPLKRCNCFNSRGRSRGMVQGVRRGTGWSLVETVFVFAFKICLPHQSFTPFLSGAPPPQKNPGSAHGLSKRQLQQQFFRGRRPPARFSILT